MEKVVLTIEDRPDGTVEIDWHWGEETCNTKSPAILIANAIRAVSWSSVIRLLVEPGTRAFEFPLSLRPLTDEEKSAVSEAVRHWTHQPRSKKEKENV